jgi:hypothetical protein
MCLSQTFANCGQGSRYTRPGEVSRPFIHPMWMRDVVWGQRCAQRARGGCTGHDGRAKPAWTACTGPAGAPHGVQRSGVPTRNHESKVPSKYTMKCLKVDHRLTNFIYKFTTSILLTRRSPCRGRFYRRKCRRNVLSDGRTDGQTDVFASFF